MFLALSLLAFLNVLNCLINTASMFLYVLNFFANSDKLETKLTIQKGRGSKQPVRTCRYQTAPMGGGGKEGY